MNTNLKSRLMSYLAGNFSCQEVANLVTDYLEGSLSLGQQLRFQMHLGMCFACRNFLKQMKYTLLTLRQLPSEPVPPHVKEELLKRFRHWKASQSSSSVAPDKETLS